MKSYCADLPLSKDVKLEANTDIAGIGVAIGLVGNAYFSLFILLGSYLLSYDAEANPFKHNGRSSATWWTPNRIDVMFLHWLHSGAHSLLKILPSGLRPSWKRDAMRRVLVTWLVSNADLQLLTGFALLTSGFVSLHRDKTTAYHWQVLVRLCWFANITHLSGLIALRGYLLKRPAEKYVRLALAFLFLVMLIVAMVPTLSFDWDDMITAQFRGWHSNPIVMPASPAICFFDTSLAPSINERAYEISCGGSHARNPYHCSRADKFRGGIPITGAWHFRQSFVAMISLAFSFFVRAAHLIEPISRWTSVHIWNRNVTCWKPRKVREHHPSDHDGAKSGDRYGVFRDFLVAFLVGIQIQLDLLRSMIVELLVLCALLAWGTVRLQETRTSEKISSEVKEEERLWSFGQMLPVLLLIGPFIMLFRASEQPKDAGERCSDARDDPEYILESSKDRLRHITRKLSRIGSQKSGKPSEITAYLLCDSSAAPSPMEPVYTSSTQALPSIIPRRCACVNGRLAAVAPELRISSSRQQHSQKSTLILWNDANGSRILWACTKDYIEMPHAGFIALLTGAFMAIVAISVLIAVTTRQVDLVTLAWGFSEILGPEFLVTLLILLCTHTICVHALLFSVISFHRLQTKYIPRWLFLLVLGCVFVVWAVLRAIGILQRQYTL
ncbi:hypothetical protein HJFPF1_02551 [Paramyrothecium foliicola]|nr:hypothetical protein HJFPF1_02551 [Paramyrothecium foliicola]